MTSIRIELPHHLRTLAGVEGEVRVQVDTPTTEALLDALEARHPMLRGTIRAHGTKERRAYLRYFADGRDLSHEPTDGALPGSVVRGEEPFTVMGAISGG